MSKYLYEVCFSGGRSNPEFQIFLRNANELKAKPPDFGGISSLCVISHHMDIDTVIHLCSDGLKKSLSDLSVTEITRKTVSSSNGRHRSLTELVNNYFLPFGDYPNLN
jgi:serine/threonine protein phosphatase PrpC